MAKLRSGKRSSFSINTLVSLGLVLCLIACSDTPKQTLISAELKERETHYSKIQIPSLDGSMIDAYLFKPNTPGPHPAIVGLHGCAGLFSSANSHIINKREMDWGKRFAAMGFWAIYPDSFGSRKIDEICTRKDMKAMPETIRPGDALGALKWLQSQKEVKADQIGIMGWSNGGSTLLWTIDENPKQKDRMKPDFKFAIAFYPGCFSVEKKKDWSNRMPLDILMGEKDNWTHPKPCKKLVERVSKSKNDIHITPYADSYHDFDRPDSPLHVMEHLAYSASGDATATVGTNEVARQSAIKKVEEILAAATH